MPTFLQASISRDPAGAVTFLPSTVMLTSLRCVSHEIRSYSQRRLCMPFLTGKACLPNDLQILCGTSSQTPSSASPPRRPAGRMCGPACFPTGNTCCRCLSYPAASMETDQRFFQPVGAFAARDAPSAAFVLVELHGAQRKFHDAGRVVEHDHAARTQHGAGLCHANRSPWQHQSRPEAESVCSIRQEQRPSIFVRSESRRQPHRSSS